MAKLIGKFAERALSALTKHRFGTQRKFCPLPYGRKNMRSLLDDELIARQKEYLVA